VSGGRVQVPKASASRVSGGGVDDAAEEAETLRALAAAASLDSSEPGVWDIEPRRSSRSRQQASSGAEASNVGPFAPIPIPLKPEMGQKILSYAQVKG